MTHLEKFLERKLLLIVISAKSIKPYASFTKKLRIAPSNVNDTNSMYQKNSSRLHITMNIRQELRTN